MPIATKLHPPSRPVTYQPLTLAPVRSRSVELECVRRGLAGTVASARQRLAELRVRYPLALQAHLTVRAFERLERFHGPADLVLSRVPVLPFRDALLAKIDGDAHEDPILPRLLERETGPAQDRMAITELYREKRLINQAIMAICARRGWT